MTSTTALDHVNRFKRSDKVRRAGGLGVYVVLDRDYEYDRIKVRDDAGLVWWGSSSSFELAPDEQPAPTPAEPAAASSPVTEAMVERAMDAFEFSLEIDPDQDLAQEAHGLREALRRSLEAALSAPTARAPDAEREAVEVRLVWGGDDRSFEAGAHLQRLVRTAAGPQWVTVTTLSGAAVAASAFLSAPVAAAPVPVVPGERELRAALDEIARQRTSNELIRDGLYASADFEGAYDQAVLLAREVCALLQQAAANPVAPVPVVPGEVERLRAEVDDLSKALGETWDALGCEHDSEAALLRIDELKAAKPPGLADELRELQELRKEVAAAYAALGSTRFMNLPDGGDPTLAEQIANMRADLEAAETKVADLTKALEKIERWHGEFPPTGCTWDDGTPVSYAANYGSNGERDFMRGVARAALCGSSSRALLQQPGQADAAPSSQEGER